MAMPGTIGSNKSIFKISYIICVGFGQNVIGRPKFFLIKKIHKMMKINNIKKVKTFMVLLILLLTVNSLILFSLIINLIQSKNDLILIAVSSLVELYVLYLISDLKFFHVENSGEVISIKNYSYWNTKNSRWSLELPKNKITSYHFKKKPLKVILSLKIERKEGTNQIVRYTIYFLQPKRIQSILESMQKK